MATFLKEEQQRREEFVGNISIGIADITKEAKDNDEQENDEDNSMADITKDNDEHENDEENSIYEEYSEEKWFELTEMSYVMEWVLMRVANPILMEQMATRAEINKLRLSRKSDNSTDMADQPALKKQRF